MKYVDRLNQSQDQRDAESSQFAAEQAKLNHQSSLLSTRSALAAARRELETLKSANPLNFQSIVDKSDHIRSLTQGEELLVKLGEELF